MRSPRRRSGWRDDARPRHRGGRRRVRVVAGVLVAGCIAVVSPLSTQAGIAAPHLTAPVGEPLASPVVHVPAHQTSDEGDTVWLPLVATADSGTLAWSATGLPAGLAIDRVSGVILGEITYDASISSPYVVTVRASDRHFSTAAGEVSFTWSVTNTNRAPSLTDPGDLAHSEGSPIAFAMVGSDPDGDPLEWSASGLPTGLTIDPRSGIISGTVGIGAVGHTTVSLHVVDGGTPPLSADASFGWSISEADEAPLTDPLATVGLQLGSTRASPIEATRPDERVGTDQVLGSVVQSLYVLRLPLALLGGTVFWSLLIGGLFNLGFVLKGGIPRVVRRASSKMAVVMVGHGERLTVRADAGRGGPVWRFPATERGIRATGRRTEIEGEEWVEVEIQDDVGWVPARHLTEEVDSAGFAEDPAPLALLDGFVSRLRRRHDVADLVSVHGLAIAHHGPVARYPSADVHVLMEDPTVSTWKGRNPAYPDFLGTFDLAVATSFLDAWDHPMRQLLHDSRAVPSTVIPVEFTNFHTISVAADLHGLERLEQPAWLVAFAYEGGRPRIAGLVKEG